MTANACRTCGTSIGRGASQCGACGRNATEHRVWDEPHAGDGMRVQCLCGWFKRHPRTKVRIAAAGKHLARTEAS